MTQAKPKPTVEFEKLRIAVKPTPKRENWLQRLVRRWPKTGTRIRRGASKTARVIAHVGETGAKFHVSFGGVVARIALTALAAEVFFLVMQPGAITLALPALPALAEPAVDASCALREHTGNTAVEPHWGAIRQWCTAIMKASSDYHFDPYLLAALILQESGGQPGVVSSSGAVGLMQVMPRDGIAAGFQCISGPCFANRPSIDELKDPDFNVDYGARLLASNVERTGSLRDALAAYGPNNVGYSYADKVLRIYDAIKE